MEVKNEEVVVYLFFDVVEFVCVWLFEVMFWIVEFFLCYYYDFVDVDDLQNCSIVDLYGVVMVYWQIVQKFVFGSECLCVYNLIFEQYGWYFDYMVIEIVNDDMLFFVDLVMMVVNCFGFVLYLVLYLVFCIWCGVGGGIEWVDVGGVIFGDGQL